MPSIWKNLGKQGSWTEKQGAKSRECLQIIRRNSERITASTSVLTLSSHIRTCSTKEKKKKTDLNSGSVVKNPPANAANTGNMGSVHGLGRSPAGGNGNPFQYSCLENPMDRGAWQATVHGVAKSRTRLSMHTQNVI